MDAEAIGRTILAVFSGAAGASGAAMYLNRRWSRDRTELRLDSADRGRISRLEGDNRALKAENDELRRIHLQDMQTITMQGAQQTVAGGDIARLRLDYERLRRRAKRQEQRLREHGLIETDEPGNFDTGVAGLDELPKDKP